MLHISFGNNPFLTVANQHKPLRSGLRSGLTTAVSELWWCLYADCIARKRWLSSTCSTYRLATTRSWQSPISTNHSVLGFTFSLSTTTPQGEGVSLYIASALNARLMRNTVTRGIFHQAIQQCETNEFSPTTNNTWGGYWPVLRTLDDSPSWWRSGPQGPRCSGSWNNVHMKVTLLQTNCWSAFVTYWPGHEQGMVDPVKISFCHLIWSPTKFCCCFSHRVKVKVKVAHLI